MLIAIYVLLMIGVGRCTDDQIFETETVPVGGDVRLFCPRESSGSLFWIRLVSGNLPEIAVKSFSFYNDRRIRTTKERGTFVLHIEGAQLSDTGLYYCMKSHGENVTFLNGTYLRVEVRPGDPVTLQCLVLTHPENKKCPGDHSVFWFRSGLDEPHAFGNKSNDCEKSPEAGSLQKCFYSFSKNVGSSDAGTYYCAVASCGEIIFGNGTKLDIEVDMWDLQTANTVLFLLSTALVIILIVILFLIYTIKKKTYDCCNAAEAASRDQQSQQRGEDSLVYSAPNFAKRKTGRAERRSVKTAEGETIYSDVRTSVID